MPFDLDVADFLHAFACFGLLRNSICLIVCLIPYVCICPMSVLCLSYVCPIQIFDCLTSLFPSPIFLFLFLPLLFALRAYEVNSHPSLHYDPE